MNQFLVEKTKPSTLSISNLSVNQRKIFIIGMKMEEDETGKMMITKWVDEMMTTKNVLYWVKPSSQGDQFSLQC